MARVKPQAKDWRSGNKKIHQYLWIEGCVEKRFPGFFLYKQNEKRDAKGGVFETGIFVV